MKANKPGDRFDSLPIKSPWVHKHQLPLPWPYLLSSLFVFHSLFFNIYSGSITAENICHKQLKTGIDFIGSL